MSFLTPANWFFGDPSVSKPSKPNKIGISRQLLSSDAGSGEFLLEEKDGTAVTYSWKLKSANLSASNFYLVSRVMSNLRDSAFGPIKGNYGIGRIFGSGFLRGLSLSSGVPIAAHEFKGPCVIVAFDEPHVFLPSVLPNVGVAAVFFQSSVGAGLLPTIADPVSTFDDVADKVSSKTDLIGFLNNTNVHTPIKDSVCVYSGILG